MLKFFMPYAPILIPIIVAVLTQIIKLSIDKIRGNLNIKNIFISYGGMPSAPTALAVSATTFAGIVEGFDSSIFALGFIFTLIIMRDAVTFRNILGKQGKLLNEMVGNLPKNEQKIMPHFMERVGHSFSEVVIGAVWGVLSTVILYKIFDYFYFNF